MYAHEEREADWPLHFKVMQIMLPYLFAVGHVIYGRFGLLIPQFNGGVITECSEVFLEW